MSGAGDAAAQMAIGRDRSGRIAFVVDADGAMLRIRLSGLWSEEVFLAFLSAYRTTSRAMSCPPGEQGVLCDAGSWPVQSREVTTMFDELVASTPSVSRIRLAVVCGTSLLAMQVRGAARSNMRVFSTRSEAETWLRGG